MHEFLQVRFFQHMCYYLTEIKFITRNKFNNDREIFNIQIKLTIHEKSIASTKPSYMTPSVQVSVSNRNYWLQFVSNLIWTTNWVRFRQIFIQSNKCTSKMIMKKLIRRDLWSESNWNSILMFHVLFHICASLEYTVISLWQSAAQKNTRKPFYE